MNEELRSAASIVCAALHFRRWEAERLDTRSHAIRFTGRDHSIEIIVSDALIDRGRIYELTKFICDDIDKKMKEKDRGGTKEVEGREALSGTAVRPGQQQQQAQPSPVRQPGDQSERRRLSVLGSLDHLQEGQGHDEGDLGGRAPQLFEPREEHEHRRREVAVNWTEVENAIRRSVRGTQRAGDQELCQRAFDTDPTYYAELHKIVKNEEIERVKSGS
jgi:hypothetical protein